MINLKGKVIAITGGEGLLGKEIIAYLNSLEATAISLDIILEGYSPNKVNLDITLEESVEQAVNYIVKTHGKIDGWVNNAYPRTKDWAKKVEDLPFESWRKNVDMHMNGYFLCCQKVLKQMALQKHGSLINMASIYGVVGPDFSVYKNSEMTMPVAYSAIKGGLITLTKYLASYYGDKNIRINAISPGGIFNNQPTEFVENYKRKVPLKRMGEPKDIYPSVAFLLSDGASYITGHNLVIDGGWIAV